MARTHDDPLAAHDLYGPLAIGEAERDRLRSILGPGDRDDTAARHRRTDPSLDEPSVAELLRAIDGKLDKLLDDGRALDDLRAELSQVRDLVGALTQLVMEIAPPRAAVRVRRRPANGAS